MQELSEIGRLEQILLKRVQRENPDDWDILCGRNNQEDEMLKRLGTWNAEETGTAMLNTINVGTVTAGQYECIHIGYQCECVTCYCYYECVCECFCHDECVCECLCYNECFCESPLCQCFENCSCNSANGLGVI